MRWEYLKVWASVLLKMTGQEASYELVSDSPDLAEEL